MNQNERLTTVMNLLRKPPRRRHGMVKLTYELLGTLLGIDQDEIMYLKIDNQAGILYIAHTDEDLICYDLAEGQCCPESTLNREKIKKNLERMNE